MSLYESISTFFSNWLFNGSISDVSLLNIGGIIQVDITQSFIVNSLSITFIIIMLLCALWLVRWFINFIFGLGGIVND